MVKKVVGGVVGTFILGTLLWGTSFFGYMRTAKDQIQQAADDAVPMSFKVQDAERMVKELKPEIKKYMGLVAEQQVDVKDLNDKIVAKEKERQKQKDTIIALKSEFDRGEKEYVFEGQSYNRDEVQSDLDRKFTRLKALDTGLETDRNQFKTRRDALKANEQSLNDMMEHKKDLEAQIDSLKSRLATAEAQKAVGTLTIDGSKMARAQKAIDDLNKRMDVEDRVRAAEGKLGSEIQIPTRKNTTNVSKDIESYLGDEAKTKTDL